MSIRHLRALRDNRSFSSPLRYAIVLAAASVLLLALLSVPVTTHAQTNTSQLNVSTDDTSSPIYGYYVTLWQNGVQTDSCFSWCGFTINNGVTYQVAASDYGNECFL